MRALSPRILRRLAKSLVLALFASRLHAADSFRLFPPPPQRYFQEIPDAARALDLDLSRPFGGSDWNALETEIRGVGSVAPRAPRRTAVTLVTLGVLGGSVASALGTGHTPESFHWANERWFQEDTYAGGGDKASHFVFYNGLSRELAVQYRIWGYGEDQATLMAFATAAAAGLIVEVGDGLTVFGFSWEDFVMDTLGAGTAAVVTRLGLDDTVGFRFGKMPSEEPPECCRTGRDREGLFDRGLHRRSQGLGVRATPERAARDRAIPARLDELRQQGLQVLAAGVPAAADRPGGRHQLSGGPGRGPRAGGPLVGARALFLLQLLPDPVHPDRRALRPEPPQMARAGRGEQL